MSAWNFNAENIHVLTPTANVSPVKTTALPVCRKDAVNASSNSIS